MSSAHVCVVLALLALLELPMAVDRACTATPTRRALHPSVSRSASLTYALR